MSRRAGDMRGIADDSMLQDASPPPKITPHQAYRAARFIEIKFRRDANIRRELLDALGLAPTTTSKPQEG